MKLMKNWIIEIASLGVCISVFVIISINQTKYNNQKFKKIVDYYMILNCWLKNKQKERNICEFFEKNNYKEIAIYGMKELGERLIDELKGQNINIKYIIDKNKNIIVNDIPVYHPNNVLPEVDAIVVTASFYFTEIKEMLESKLDCEVVSIDDVIFSQY